MDVVRGTSIEFLPRLQIPSRIRRWYHHPQPDSALEAAKAAEERCKQSSIIIATAPPPRMPLPMLPPVRHCSTPRPKSMQGKKPAPRARRRARDVPLSRREIRELQGRDLTPEDYELLLRLDEPIDAQRQKALSQTDLSACVRTGQAVPAGDTTCAIC